MDKLTGASSSSALTPGQLDADGGASKSTDVFGGRTVSAAQADNQVEQDDLADKKNEAVLRNIGAVLRDIGDRDIMSTKAASAQLATVYQKIFAEVVISVSLPRTGGIEFISFNEWVERRDEWAQTPEQLYQILVKAMERNQDCKQVLNELGLSPMVCSSVPVADEMLATGQMQRHFLLFKAEEPQNSFVFDLFSDEFFAGSLILLTGCVDLAKIVTATLTEYYGNLHSNEDSESVVSALIVDAYRKWVPSDDLEPSSIVTARDFIRNVYDNFGMSEQDIEALFFAVERDNRMHMSAV